MTSAIGGGLQDAPLMSIKGVYCAYATHREQGGEQVAVEQMRRVNVNFSPQAYSALEQLARQKGKTMSEVLRDAIALEQWFETTRQEGGRVLVERDGEVRELLKV